MRLSTWPGEQRAACLIERCPDRYSVIGVVERRQTMVWPRKVVR